jgi:hypothetical protein
VLREKYLSALPAKIVILAALALPLTATAQHLTEETTCTPREYAQYREQAFSGKRGTEEVVRGYCLNGVVRKLHRDLAANYASVGFTLAAMRQQQMANDCHAEMRKAADALVAVGFLKDAGPRSMQELPDCGKT